MTTADRLVRAKTDIDEVYRKGLADGTKEEQEKSITITENGTTEIVPDENKVLSKVTVEVDVESGGGNSFYDDFWDAYQQNGELTDYNTKFASGRFSSKSFYPKYDIRPTKSAYGMFQSFPDELDLIQRLKDCGVVLDTTGCTNVSNIFAYASKITTVPTIDASNSTSIQEMFTNCFKLHTVEKLIVSSKIIGCWNAFSGCGNLENIVFEGELCVGLTLSGCKKLSMASVDSLINILTDLTGQESQKVSFHTNIILALTDEQYSKITAKNWTV